MKEQRTELTEKELKDAVGGDEILRVCACGCEITLSCEFRIERGHMQLRCPDCGTWHDF